MPPPPDSERTAKELMAGYDSGGTRSCDTRICLTGDRDVTIPSTLSQH
jgi:hypothetical protein